MFSASCAGFWSLCGYCLPTNTSYDSSISELFSQMTSGSVPASSLCCSERDHPPGYRRGPLGPAPPVRLAGWPQQYQPTLHQGVPVAPPHPTPTNLRRSWQCYCLFFFLFFLCLLLSTSLHKLISKCLAANEQPETIGLTFLTHSGNHSSQRIINFQ